MAAQGDLPRLADVASQAGVSLATASRSLSGSSGVSAAVASHVRDVAAQMGYVANAHARSLAGGSAHTIGLIVHEIGDPYFSEIASGALRVAGQKGRMVQIVQAERSAAGELAQIRALRAHRVGAIILAGSGYTDSSLETVTELELQRFESSGGRAAVIGRHHLTVDAVLPDNHGAGLTLGRHILALGHREVAIVAGPLGLTTVKDRLEGLEQAFAAAGSTTANVTVIHDEFTRAGGSSAAEAVLVRRPNATAIIAINDVMAIGVLATLRERGIRVPSDISVAGFGDISVASALSPSLTSVDIAISELGATAVKLTMAEALPRPRSRRMGHALKKRDSTGPPRPFDRVPADN